MLIVTQHMYYRDTVATVQMKISGEKSYPTMLYIQISPSFQKVKGFRRKK